MDFKALQSLKRFLLSREADIAWDIEDFGDLREIFIDIFQREPKKEA